MIPDQPPQRAMQGSPASDSLLEHHQLRLGKFEKGKEGKMRVPSYLCPHRLARARKADAGT